MGAAGPTITAVDIAGPEITSFPEQGFGAADLLAEIDAVRAGDRKLLTCDIEEGHLSAALAHLGNIAYRVKRGLRFDGKTERFVGDPEADKLLTRPYRAPFVIPEKV